MHFSRQMTLGSGLDFVPTLVEGSARRAHAPAHYPLVIGTALGASSIARRAYPTEFVKTIGEKLMGGWQDADAGPIARRLQRLHPFPAAARQQIVNVNPL